MRVFEWIILNWELICVVLAIAVNFAAVIYNIFKLCRSGAASDAEAWLAILEAAREYEKEAEVLGGSAAEKLEYVLAHLRDFTLKIGCGYDRERLTELINADIAFTKCINAPDRSEKASG